MENKLIKIGFAVLASLAVSKSYAYESSHSIGLGLQYGGIFGWQAAVSGEHLNGRFAVGILGASLGGDLYLNKHISLGVTGTSIFFGSSYFESVNLNYYINGRDVAGWRLGLDVAASRGDSLMQGGHGDNDASGHGVLLSVGYRF